MCVCPHLLNVFTTYHIKSAVAAAAAATFNSTNGKKFLRTPRLIRRIFGEIQRERKRKTNEKLQRKSKDHTVKNFFTKGINLNKLQ